MVSKHYWAPQLAGLARAFGNAETREEGLGEVAVGVVILFTLRPYLL
jgi:hypothetical protein